MASGHDLLRLARAAADRAGAYLRSVERPDPRDWSAKGRHDFVTDVDRTAEGIVAESLLAAEPSGRIIGEELSPDDLAHAAHTARGLAWVVDPLDGTTNFLHGYPMWAVSIAAVVDGVLEAGVVLHVPRNECYHAVRGGGAWLGERRLAVSAIDDPSLALIGTGIPFKNLAELGAYQRQLAGVVAATSGVRRAGSAALDLCDVAAGRFEAFWEQRLAPWDIAAGMLLVREAGGRVTDFEGRDLGIEHAPTVAGSPAMHAWLLGVLRDGASAPVGG